MTLRAVFVDLGGTLIDLESDRRAHLDAMDFLSRAFGLPWKPLELLGKYEALREERYQSLGTRWQQDREITREVLNQILNEQGLPMTDSRWEEFLKVHWLAHYHNLRLLPRAEEVLRNLKGRGLHLGLLSDTDEDFLQMCLFMFPLERYLDSITTSEEVGVAKPHIGIFAAALAKAGCRPHEAVHIGDSLKRDVEGARELGMRTILIDSSGDSNVADIVVQAIADAPQALETLAREWTP